ncbi:MAG: hypothetical protein P8J88_07785, partial [Phycisphaerales bacterium]|nr:hypothetical protein [Phycisphaerales bacterium]
MSSTNHATFGFLSSLVVVLNPVVFAEEGTGTGRDEDVWLQIESLRAEIGRLRDRQADVTLDATRRTEIRRLITDVVADAEMRTNRIDRPWNVIASADGDFTLEADVIMQYDW